MSDQNLEKNFWKKQQEIHGNIPNELIDETPKAGADVSKFQKFVGMGSPVEVGGRYITVKEPTWKQIKREILPLFRSLPTNQADYTPETLSRIIATTTDLQRLVFDCIQFDGEAPEDPSEWLDDLPLSDVVKLVRVFTEGINWTALIEDIKAIQKNVSAANL
jgi:hypothetical protein